MTSLRRRWAALVIVPLLAVGLTACAEAEPAALPTASPTPSPTETVSAPSPPGSRVPVDCTQIFDSLDGFVVVETTVRDQGPVYTALLAQAGFLHCEVEGLLGGTQVSTQVVVGVDFPRQTIESLAAEALQFGDFATSGADLAFSNCTVERVVGYCTATSFANGYVVQYSIGALGAVGADFDQAYARFESSLGDRIASWGAPPAPWQAPEGTLAGGIDCEGELASTDSEVLTALPFAVDAASFPDSGDGFWLTYEAEKRAGVAECEWYGAGGTLAVTIIPGAAWYFEQPGALPGSPYDYPGAIATITSDVSSVFLRLVVGGSLVFVWLSDSTSTLDSDALAASARTIADAVVSELQAS